MAEKDMDKFMEILKRGDSDELVKFAKTLTNCPHCDEKWEIKNNNLKCGGCGLTILNVDRSVVPDNAGIW